MQTTKMLLAKPKRKRKLNLPQKQDFCEIASRNFKAIYNGSSIYLDFVSGIELHRLGYFGKGSQSRSIPTSEGELLYLMPEEAFYLSYKLNCLTICDQNNIEISSEKLWEHFCHNKDVFPQRFAVYSHFRKNWIVKSGLNYGGDFLLYKESPETHHSTYIVLVCSENSSAYSWLDITAGSRVAETVSKDLLFCEVINLADNSLKSVGKCSVRQYLVRRWVPQKE